MTPEKLTVFSGGECPPDKCRRPKVRYWLVDEKGHGGRCLDVKELREQFGGLNTCWCISADGSIRDRFRVDQACRRFPELADAGIIPSDAQHRARQLVDRAEFEAQWAKCDAIVSKAAAKGWSIKATRAVSGYDKEFSVAIQRNVECAPSCGPWWTPDLSLLVVQYRVWLASVYILTDEAKALGDLEYEYMMRLIITSPGRFGV